MSEPCSSIERTGAVTASWDVGVALDQRLHAAHDYWNSRRGSRRMPSRSDIDPTDIPRLLPFLFLAEVLPGDFRFRLAGAHFREFAGVEITGRLTGEVFPAGFNAEVLYHWSSCVKRKAPKLGTGKLWVPDRSHVMWEGIVMPLSANDDAVNMLFGAVVFSYAASAPPTAPLN